MFSGLNTPKLQTLGLTRKGRPFFMTYQTHFLRQYPPLGAGRSPTDEFYR